MTRKPSITTLSFTYSNWHTSISKCQATKSIKKMQKMVSDDIKCVLAHGFKYRRILEPALDLKIPFFYPSMQVSGHEKVKVEFGSNCVFECDTLPKLLQNKDEELEIHCDGVINVTIIWKN